jgi:hypothetical protein
VDSQPQRPQRPVPRCRRRCREAAPRRRRPGELVILGADGRLSFDAFQQRLGTSPAKARGKAARLPAAYAAFDLLAIGGIDLRAQRWTARRNRLELLAATWAPYPD